MFVMYSFLYSWQNNDCEGNKKKRTLGPIDTNEKTVTLLENHRKLGTGRYYPTTGRNEYVGPQSLQVSPCGSILA